MITRTTLLIMIVIGLGGIVRAEVFTERMTSDQAKLLLNKLSEVSRAADERAYAVDQQPHRLVFNSRSGSPSSVVHQLKFKIRSFTPSFVNISYIQDGTYNAWFSSLQTNADRRKPGFSQPVDFPYWSESTISTFTSIPVDYFLLSPSGGKEILESASYGISPCYPVLHNLVHLPVKTVEQQNTAKQYSLITNEHMIVRLYDEGRCITNSCTSRTDTESDGNPVTHGGCAIPSTDPADQFYSGPSTWEISFSASHHNKIRQNTDDYTCLAGRSTTWNRTRTKDESATIDYSRQFPITIDLLCLNLKPDVAGRIKPYSRFNYSPRSAQVITNNVVIGCENIYCDEYDDDGNVIGQSVCGKRNISTPREYTVPGWQPHLVTNYIFSGHGDEKTTGLTSLLVNIPIPSDPFGSLNPSTTFDENYSCNASYYSGNFGLYCYGTLGPINESESLVVTIPNLRLDYEIKPVLLEAHFAYCR